jgi:spermidine/putrescine transport system substrate-binding protein
LEGAPVAGRALRAVTWPGMPSPRALAVAASGLGRAVTIEAVSSNEELESLLGSDPAIDLIFPSDYLVERLIGTGRLCELDLAPGTLDRLAPWGRELACDPGCRWSVPFAFGTTGYLFDVDLVLGDPRSWSLLFAEGPPVGMLDEVRELAGAALIASGYNPNDISPRPLAVARELLEAQRHRVARYDSRDFVSPVAEGKLAAHHAWSGPAAQAARAHRRLRYVVPEEGAVLWVTTGAVPAEAPEPDLSMALLSRLTEPELAVRTTVEYGFATPNVDARALLPAALREDANLFADSATLQRCQTLHDLGEGEACLAGIVPN